MSKNKMRMKVKGHKSLKIFIILPLVLFLLFQDTANAGELKKYVPREVVHEFDSKRFFYDDNNVSLEIALKLSEFIYKKYGDSDIPVISKIPGRNDTYLVSAHGEGNKNDNGRRFFLLKLENDKVDTLYIGKGAWDSYILRPIFYYGETKILILAELGTEYSWGLKTYEFHKEKLRYLGNIDIALDPEDQFSDLTSPLRNEKVEYKNETYYVSFFGKLYMHPGGKDQRLIKSNSVTYYFDGNKFVQLKRKMKSLNITVR